jgi:Flp pilus assembly protein TadD
LAPKNPVPRMALAGAYVSLGRNEEAERILSDAKQHAPDDPAMYRLLGDYYIARGDSARSLREFGALFVQHRRDLQVQKTYIQLLILNHRLDEATTLMDEVLKSSSRDAQALLLQGQIQIQRGNFNDSISTLQQAVKLAPDIAFGHYQLGVAFHMNGKAQQAEGEWQTAVRLAPNFHDAWSALGASAVQRGDWRAADSISKQLQKIAPASTEGYLLEATARFNQGDASAAEADLKRVLDLAPQSAIGYAKLGRLRTEQHRWAEAENSYRKALAQEPGSFDALEGLVDLDFRLGRAADAIGLIQAQAERTPDNPRLYSLLGQAFLRNGKPDEAEKMLIRAADLDKHNVGDQVLLGKMQASRGATDLAISSYQRAIELAPNNVGLYVDLGGVYELRADWQKAESLYQKALSIQSDDAPAANNLAYLMLEHGGDVNVALTLAQTARRGLQGMPNSADTLGWAYYHNGSFSAAASLLEEAVKKAPSNSTYLYHLGLIYAKLNDHPRARAQFERAINVDPKSPIAEQARTALVQVAGS